MRAIAFGLLFVGFCIVERSLASKPEADTFAVIFMLTGLVGSLASTVVCIVGGW